MIQRRFGRVVNITSTSVKAPIPTLGLSNGARAGLTGFIAGLARQVALHNVTINNLLPGPFDTDRLRATMAGAAKSSGRSVEDVMEDRRRQNPAGRFGTAEEFGQFCAFMCSAQASYFTGQNVVLDGGAYPGTL
jgi:3-oxoacyl-[acyl-carrier protein] reductase